MCFPAAALAGLVLVFGFGLLSLYILFISFFFYSIVVCCWFGSLAVGFAWFMDDCDAYVDVVVPGLWMFNCSLVQLLLDILLIAVATLLCFLFLIFYLFSN